jgi:hypothetical protein
VICLLAASGCASYSPPKPVESPSYLLRMASKVHGDVQVSAVVLSDAESQEAFAAPLGENHIQPVWFEVENREDKQCVFMVVSVDPEYFSPAEAAWVTRAWGESNTDEKIHFFLDQHIPLIIEPMSTTRGFVYTNHDPGAKAFSVDLLRPGELRRFQFLQKVPGFSADFDLVDFNSLYAPEEIRDLDLEGLRAYLEGLPCCVLGGDRATPGDPMNIVVVGDGTQVLSVFIRRGWDLTETATGGAAWRTVTSSLFGSKYRTSPVSALYVFDRPQDVALQKARGTVDERNHLRLWMTPVTFEGKRVWVGQISRDIGVKFSSKTFVTHKIDPVIDEARTYLLMDLAASRSVKALGYAAGVGPSTFESPRYNYTKDPYYTDGLRVVIFLQEEPIPIERLKQVDWEKPGTRNHGRTAPSQ